jgi:hypothetical protein
LEFAELHGYQLKRMSNYLISISKNERPNGGTIHDIGSKLKVRAFDLIRSKFKPSRGEVRFFVTDGKQKFAFETKGYKKHRELLILHMISSYCIYLGLIEARIQTSWPF